MDFELLPEHEDFRHSVRELMRAFPDSYWADKDAAHEYPFEFYHAFADAGYLGTAIPEEYGLDFIVPIMFLAMVGPLLKTPAHIAAAVTSVVVALLLVGLPSGTGLLAAALCAMVAGVVVETLQDRSA